MRTVQKLYLRLLFIGLAVLLLPAHSVQARDVEAKTSYAPGELLIKYKPHARKTASEFFEWYWKVKTVKKYNRVNIDKVKLPPGMTVEEALAIFSQDPDVELVEPNYLRHAAIVPDDDFFDRLWGLRNTGQNVNGRSGTSDADIDANNAWSVETGNRNIVVAVVDSGLDYNHPDINGNVWINIAEFTGTDGVDDDGNGYVDDIRGWDFVDEDNDPMDADGHGTHVAGIISAEGNNNRGVAGICWNVKIMPLKFLNALGTGTVADEIEAIDYAIDNGADIINASYGSTGTSELEASAIARAREAGILFIAAAGNGGKDVDSDGAKEYPASYTQGDPDPSDGLNDPISLTNIISVASTDLSDNLTPFSNFGESSVDVAAPGLAIFSLKPDRQEVWSFDFESGTTGWNLENLWGTTEERAFTGDTSLTDSPSEDYGNDVNASARSPQLDLSSHNGAILSFKIRGEVENEFDHLFLETASNSGGPWTEHAVLIDESLYDSGITGEFDSWQDGLVDLGSLDGEGPLYFRFRLLTDSSVTKDGYYLDDMSIKAADTTYSDDSNDYAFLSGTSLSTPYVTGLAALILSRDSTLSFSKVRERIFNGVDHLSSLDGKILTGGRINAYNSIRNMPSAPKITAAPLSSSQVRLNWQSYVGDISFVIQRKSNSSSFSEIARTGRTTTYTDSGLESSTTYVYRIKAVNSDNESEYSSTVSATTESDGGGGGGGGGCITSNGGSLDVFWLLLLVPAFRLLIRNRS